MKLEAQRKYLGGDGEHSVLVKGLDFALLEQNKAKYGFTADDADEIEKALMESSSSRVEPAVPKKRTREDLIKDLKAKRAKGESPATVAPADSPELEVAKQQGKFKPIGFKPIGATEEKKKKKKGDGDRERKKKRKVEGETNKGGDVDMLDETQKASTSKAAEPPRVEEAPEPVDKDFDIFADVGEYEGLDIDEDDEDEGKTGAMQVPPDAAAAAPPPRRWIDDDEPPAAPPEPTPEPSTRVSHHPNSRPVSEGEMSEDEKPMRLVPLASSALPSIKDLLEADKAAASYTKNKKKKDKKKKAKGEDDDDDDDQDDEKAKQKSMAAKVDRDYKK